MTNNQAQGYVLLACKELGIGREQAEQLIYAMESQFDYYTEWEARGKELFKNRYFYLPFCYY